MRHLYQACPTWYRRQEKSSHPAQLRRSAGLIVAGCHPGVDCELAGGLSAVQHEGAADEHEPAVLVALRLIALRHMPTVTAAEAYTRHPACCLPSSCHQA